MKKYIFCLTITVLSMALLPAGLKASPDSARTQTATIQSEKAERLIHRLEEIKAIDKSTLSRTERKALRKEVRSIDTELRGLSGGIYISVGALILILLLLIILF